MEPVTHLESIAVITLLVTMKLVTTDHNIEIDTIKVHNKLITGLARIR